MAGLDGGQSVHDHQQVLVDTLSFCSVEFGDERPFLIIIETGGVVPGHRLLGLWAEGEDSDIVQDVAYSVRGEGDQ